MLLEKKRFWCGLGIPLSMLLTWLAHLSPAATERWFSMGVYRFIAATYGRVFGYLPFSVAQFLIVIVPVGMLLYIMYELYSLVRNFVTRVGYNEYRAYSCGEERKKIASRLVANVLCAVGVLWLMFTLGAGLNYARQEFGYTIGLESRPSYPHELAALTEILVQQANALSHQVERNEYGHMVISAPNFRTLSNEAREIFRNAGDEFPVLAGFVPHTKPVVYSRILSRARIAGVYIPWTMEPHVNADMMPYNIPATILHELAHFRGIMREDEANFVAWIVGHHSGHPDFMYSSTMLALSYAAGQLSRVDSDAHARIMGNLCPYVQLDRRANREYWQQFQGTLADISQAANDAYLRANRQEDGVQSYGRVVDWLLAYFREG